MGDFSAGAKIYPLMPLRDIVLFPHMVAPLVVGRERSIKALEQAMADHTEIFLAVQKEATAEDPTEDDLHEVGTVAVVMQLLRLPDGTIKALVEGKRRARVLRHLPHAHIFKVEVEELGEKADRSSAAAAYLRELRASFQAYIQHYKKVPAEVVKSLGRIEDPARYVDVMTAHLPLSTVAKQEVLATLDHAKRYDLVLNLLHQEIEIAQLEANIRGRVKKKIDKNQKDYYLSEQMRIIQKEMGLKDDPASDLADLERRIKAKKLPKAPEEKVEHELKKLKLMPAMSAEATVVRNYIDCILNLPWKERGGDAELDLGLAEKILDEDHFGLARPKERILEYLAVKARVDKLKGPILCLVGPPGVGKTSICKSVARAMGRRFERLSLGGVRDEAEIRGHRRTYIGAMPGKILRAMQKARVSDPVLCLDEVDKMSMDFRGDPSAALLEVLDPEQNSAFTDHYLDLEYDLSDVLFITTANNLAGIPAPLQDRMEIIRISGYTEEDKLSIAQGFLIPKQLEANGFAASDITFPTPAIREIIRRYTREAGVRNLDRAIASVCRKVARDSLKRKGEKRYRLTPAAINRYLGVPKFRFGLAEDEDRVGLVTGLAWTEVGGELLQIETALMPGKGKMTVTGKLGEVMQESAQAALTYVRTRARRLNLEPDFYQKLDIHIHVPEGAIPKDGPSAGITMATSLVSALLRVPVKRDLAMTGEITLRGRVLPIGGLAEKLLAAKRGNIKRVLIPRENQRNLEEIPAKILKGLQIDPVANVDEVLSAALLMPVDRPLFHDQGDGDELETLHRPLLPAADLPALEQQHPPQ